MMKYLMACLLVVLSATTACSQGCGSSNPNCIVTTQPPGTNNNTAASTAFVVANPAFSGPIQATTFSSPATSSWFTDDVPPGNVNYLNDRIFLGGATFNNGKFSGTLSGDWFSTFQNSIGEPFGYIGNTQLASFTNPANQYSAYGFLGASESLSFVSGVSSIGVVGVAVNNNTTKTTIGYGMYSECHQRTGAHFVGCFANESDPRTEVATNQPDPFTNAVIVSYQAGCGAGVASTGHPCGAAYQVVANPETYNVGINIENGSVTAGAGPSGSTVAMSLPAGYSIVWYSSAGTAVGAINVDSSGNMNLVATTLKFNGVAVTVP